MFIDNLEKILKEKKISKSDIAKNTSISKSTISEWKSGRLPKIDKIEILANYLECSTDILIKGIENGITIDETILLNAYNQANNAIKESVNKLLDINNTKEGKSLNSKIG